MNIVLLKSSILKMINEAITLAKDPTVTANAEDLVNKYTPEIVSYIESNIKTGKLTNFIPVIFGFISGALAGACVLLLILANKAGLL